MLVQVSNAPILLTSIYSENARAFERTVNGKVLDFEYSDGKLIDSQTNSEWNYEGLATSGTMKGTQLTRMPMDPGFWFEWVAFHPDTEVYGA